MYNMNHKGSGYINDKCLYTELSVLGHVESNSGNHLHKEAFTENHAEM